MFRLERIVRIVLIYFSFIPIISALMGGCGGVSWSQEEKMFDFKFRYFPIPRSHITKVEFFAVTPFISRRSIYSSDKRERGFFYEYERFKELCTDYFRLPKEGVLSWKGYLIIGNIRETIKPYLEVIATTNDPKIRYIGRIPLHLLCSKEKIDKFTIIMMPPNKLVKLGSSPELRRFGHSLTYLPNGQILIGGGAVGTHKGDFIFAKRDIILDIFRRFLTATFLKSQPRVFSPMYSELSGTELMLTVFGGIFPKNPTCFSYNFSDFSIKLKKCLNSFRPLNDYTIQMAQNSVKIKTITTKLSNNQKKFGLGNHNGGWNGKVLFSTLPKSNLYTDQLFKNHLGGITINNNTISPQSEEWFGGSIIPICGADRCDRFLKLGGAKKTREPYSLRGLADIFTFFAQQEQAKATNSKFYIEKNSKCTFKNLGILHFAARVPILSNDGTLQTYQTVVIGGYPPPGSSPPRDSYGVYITDKWLEECIGNSGNPKTDIPQLSSGGFIVKKWIMPGGIVLPTGQILIVGGAEIKNKELTAMGEIYLYTPGQTEN